MVRGLRTAFDFMRDFSLLVHKFNFKYKTRKKFGQVSAIPFRWSPGAASVPPRTSRASTEFLTYYIFAKPEACYIVKRKPWFCWYSIFNRCNRLKSNFSPAIRSIALSEDNIIIAALPGIFLRYFERDNDISTDTQY